MNTNLHQQIEKNKKEAEESFRNALLGKNIDIYSVIEAAREETLKDAARKPSHYKAGRNYMAEGMYNNMIGIATDNYPALVQFDDENRPYLSLTPTVRLYFKKLNDKYLPSNITTKYVKKLQGQELFDDAGTQIHIVNAGYVLKDNDYTQNFKGVYASYTNRYYPGEVGWVIDLATYKTQGGIIVTTQQAAAETDTLVKVIKPGGSSTAKGQQ